MKASKWIASLAVGAALENVRRTARYNHWDLEPEEPLPGELAALRLSEPDGPAGKIDPIVLERVTNRRAYDGRPLLDGTRARLEQAGYGHSEGCSPTQPRRSWPGQSCPRA